MVAGSDDTPDGTIEESVRRGEGHLDRRRWLAVGALGGMSLLGVGGAARALAATGASPEGRSCAPLLAHTLRPLTGGATAPLCERFSDVVLLIVNTASRCGFTPQFDGLERLHQRYSASGLQVLGFPSDDFRQELADEAEVASFCRLNYGVTFPMFQKVGVRGETAHPLFHELAAATDGYPDWNFNKYLVDRAGRPLRRYGSSVLPLGERLVDDIEALL